MASSRSNYIPALRFERLTPLFDPVVRVTTRERTFKRRLIDQAEIAPGHRVLDLGCGTGTLAAMVKEAQPKADVVGLDGDPAVLQQARRKTAGLGIGYDQGLADDLPYPDASFDRVLSTLLFHHLTREVKEAALREVARVLKPGGELHVADFGEARSPFARGRFLLVQVFDGFGATGDNVAGRLPGMIAAAGLGEVRERERLGAALGTVSLLSARRAEA